MKLPSDIGRISGSMSAWKRMKAQEWKNWLFSYSLYCLRNVLQRKHYDVWVLFVVACKIMIRPSITREETFEASRFLTEFSQKFEDLYGKKSCIPNMHMSMHIKQCILDYGPVYSFWCFSFERYNGVLGKFCTNNKSISIQIMRKFLAGQRINSSFSTLQLGGIPSFQDMKLSQQTDKSTLSVISIYEMKRLGIGNNIYIYGNFHENLSVPKLDSIDVPQLAMIAENICSQLNIEVKVSKMIYSYSRIKLGGDVITSTSYRSGSSKDHFVHAVHMSPTTCELRPALVRKIFDVIVTIKEDTSLVSKSFKYVYVDWFQNHQFKDHYGDLCPMKLWSTTFEAVDASNFIPINFIHGKSIVTKCNVKFKNDSKLCASMKYKPVDVVYCVI